MKICSKCRIEKPPCEFHRSVHTKSGLTPQCKVCRNSASLKWFRANHHRQRERSLEYYRNNREVVSERRSRARYANHDARLAHERAEREKNRESYREYVRNWQRRNPEYNSARKRAWEKKRPASKKLMVARYRARLRAMRLHTITRSDLEARISVFGNRCAYCGSEWAHLDHVKPISKGGPHCLSNLRPACVSCNRRKSNKTPQQWFAELKEGSRA
jgi:5-methylcytosine-specific restriction endonuclease McrA